MNTTFYRVDRHRVARRSRPQWLTVAEDALFYFGITLLPLLLAIALFQLGWIA